MALRSWALGAALVSSAAAELHCVGQLAHEVQFSDHEDWWIAVAPAPARDRECAHDADRHLCVGVNHDETCRAAKNPSIPMPLHAKCSGCFVGASTDVFYHLNISRFAVQSIGVGFRGTTVLSTLQLADDQGWAGKPRQGSRTFLEKPLEFHLKLGKLMDLDVKLEMPTTLHYEVLARENVHGDLGATVEVDMGDNYVQYQKGQGWTHHKEKPQWRLTPKHEGDYDAIANMTLGFESSWRAQIGKLAWFHVDMSTEVPLSSTSVGASGSDVIHNCLDVGLKFDVTHEAEFDLSVLGHNFTKHWGPHADRHHDGSAVHKCKDLHPHPPAMTVVV